MTVKFNMRIRIGADEFMDMIARYLPFELQSIEEIVELPMPKAPPAVVALANRLKIKAARKKYKRADLKPDLKKGMNRIIMEALESGPRTNIESRDALVKGGYSPNSTTAQMQKLVNHNIVRRTDRGVWELVVPAPE